MLGCRIVDANKGRSVVPVLRYFVVMGCCLLGLLFAIDYMAPKEASPALKAEAATAPSGGSLASWRQSQEKLEKPQTAAAVIYPAVASMPATAERLRWERQLTFREPDRVSPSLEARAELPATAAEAITAPAPPARSVTKPAPRPKTVARTERHERPNYAAAYPPAPLSQYGGYRQAQFERPYPYGGGFFGFRMF
jgi:hypothetical protein